MDQRKQQMLWGKPERMALPMTFGFTLFLLITIICIVEGFVRFDSSEVERYRQLFIDANSLRPERKERLLFFIFVVALLPIAWWSLRLARLANETIHHRLYQHAHYLHGCRIPAFALFVGLQFYFFYHSELIDWIWPRNHFDAWFWLIWVSVFVLAMHFKWSLRAVTVRIGSNPPGYKIVEILLWVTAFVLCFTLFSRLIDMSWLLTLVDLWSLISLLSVLLYITCAAIGNTKFAASSSLKWLLAHEMRLMTVLIFFSSLSILVIEARRIQGISFVITDRSKWTSHFEAIFYSVSQVTGGKTLLVDLPSQYGFYSELLAPWFRLIGLSVLKFSLTMSALLVIGQASLLWLCAKQIRSPKILLLAIFSLLALTTSAWHYIALNLVDPYYQYWPLRFIFPSISCLLFSIMFARQFSSLSMAAGAITSGIAMIWNLDSGVPTFGALLAYFLYRTTFAPDSQRKEWFFRSLLVCLYVLSVVVFFGCFLYLKSGRAINFSDAFRYQNIFYTLGYYMLPMQLKPSPWMVVLVYYVFGVVYAFWNRSLGREEFHFDLIFYLSILGIGLFSYYQGRSHELNLLSVMWPAVVIGFFLADRVLFQVRRRILDSVYVLLTVPVMVFGGLCVWVLMLGCSALLQKIPPMIELWGDAGPKPVIQNIDFIKVKAGQSSKVAIIAPHQAIYFGETRLVSAIKGPGLAEMALLEDRERFISSLVKCRIDHVFLQENNAQAFLAPYFRIFSVYHVDSVSDSGMLHLIPDAESPSLLTFGEDPAVCAH